jgi:hypothetical protein
MLGLLEDLPVGLDEVLGVGTKIGLYEGDRVGLVEGRASEDAKLCARVFSGLIVRYVSLQIRRREMNLRLQMGQSSYMQSNVARRTALKL